MESDKRVLHNVHIGGVDKDGTVGITFSQFTDAKGIRHLLPRAITVHASAKAPLLLVLEEAHAAAEAVAAADRRAPLPAHSVTIHGS